MLELEAVEPSELELARSSELRRSTLETKTHGHHLPRVIAPDRVPSADGVTAVMEGGPQVLGLARERQAIGPRVEDVESKSAPRGEVATHATERGELRLDVEQVGERAEGGGD